MYPPEPTLGRDEDFHERIDAVQRRLEQVEYTLRALATDLADVQIAGPCTHCERSLLLVTENTLSCPACHYRRSL